MNVRSRYLFDIGALYAVGLLAMVKPRLSIFHTEIVTISVRYQFDKDMDLKQGNDGNSTGQKTSKLFVKTSLLLIAKSHFLGLYLGFFSSKSFF